MDEELSSAIQDAGIEKHELIKIVSACRWPAAALS
jgi:hypothetical protein